ncbi:RDD family protein [Corynebacterium pacaense]|uniref:RDD family protein n=1 Tax=Corynebacterium pacaense TaxID=1816684 RepID=UPI0009BA54EA|nr:RDD family protein [Corynebacterium pacaense]
MNNDLPTLYSAFDLDRSDDSEELGLVLSARDLRLEQMGVPDTDPRRTQTVLAFSVLADPGKRAIYDERIDAGAALTWDQIRHLGSFGSLDSFQGPVTGQSAGAQPTAFNNPFATPQPETSQEPQPGGYGYAFGDPAPTPFAGNVNASMYGSPGFSTLPTTHSGFAAPSPIHDRPTSGTRLQMAIVDLIIAAVGSGIIIGILGADGLLDWLLGTLLMIAYVVGFESVMGATPAKKMFGYEVRDVTTGSRLSAGASFKRNWWKFLGAVPALGGLVTLIMAAVYGSSINPSNQMRGIHDKMANAEVVKKH